MLLPKTAMWIRSVARFFDSMNICSRILRTIDAKLLTGCYEATISKC